MSVTAIAPGKINLTLDVVGTRADGYHLLESIFQSVSICDTVTAEKADTITLDAPACDCPVEKNTAYKAAVAFFRYTGMAGGVKLTLTKRIPQQAGMGGGSADAAGVLVALNALYEAGLTEEQLCEIGLTVGADVPFCVMGGTAFVTGIGEGLRPLPPLPPFPIVVAQPAEGVSTGAAYAAIDGADSLRHPDHDVALTALKNGDFSTLFGQAENVFEQVICLDGVTAIRQRMAAHNPLCCRMTGSGSAVFAVFSDEEAANRCLDDLRQDFPAAFLCYPCGGVTVE